MHSTTGDKQTTQKKSHNELEIKLKQITRTTQTEQQGHQSSQL